MMPDKDAIDALAAEFFDAFTNGGGVPGNIDRLYEIFIPEAIVVMSGGAANKAVSVRDFVEPRREILTNGALEDFREWEVAEVTEIAGTIAHRFSRYEKSWIAAGTKRSGSGVKSLQFVRTDRGWQICALAWADD
jgi:hypothetical protein